MADTEINVTSWAEFVTAIGTNNAIVNCPLKAEWDMNEIAPEGIAGYIPLACATINGNGTVIKNLHLTSGNFRKDRVVTINDLSITNFICETRDESGGRAFFYGYSSNNSLYLNRCIISGLGNQYMNRLSNTNTYIDRCSINVDFTSAAYAFGVFPLADAKYSRIKQNVQNMNGSFTVNFGNCNFCELDVYMPQATTINVQNISGCKLIGGFGSAVLANVDTARSFVSIFLTQTLPSAEGGTYVKGVTDAQMKDAAYLASIGFPIGV